MFIVIYFDFFIYFCIVVIVYNIDVGYIFIYNFFYMMLEMDVWRDILF